MSVGLKGVAGEEVSFAFDVKGRTLVRTVTIGSDGTATCTSRLTATAMKTDDALRLGASSCMAIGSAESCKDTNRPCGCLCKSDVLFGSDVGTARPAQKRFFSRLALCGAHS